MSIIVRRKRSPIRLTENQALDRMPTGSTLVHMSPNPNKPADYRWFVVPGGPVKSEVAERIKEHPGVVSGKDGLWPNHDQTWKMRSFAEAQSKPAA
jgi:hypothetical protein